MCSAESEIREKQKNAFRHGDHGGDRRRVPALVGVRRAVGLRSEQEERWQVGLMRFWSSKVDLRDEKEAVMFTN